MARKSKPAKIKLYKVFFDIYNPGDSKSVTEMIVTHHMTLKRGQSIIEVWDAVREEFYKDNLADEEDGIKTFLTDIQEVKE